MNDFALVLTLLGLIAFSVVVIYFLIWREPPRPPREERDRTTGERVREQSG